MTLNETSEKFRVTTDILREYETNGLLENTKYSEDISDYSEEFVQRIYLINLLLRSGMDMNDLKSYLHLLDEKTESRDEQIRRLRKQRCTLLEEIHYKQQILDELDYMIREVKNGGSH